MIATVNQPIKTNRPNQGFSLLELLLALVVIASILLLATYYYRVARENTRITQAVNLIDQVSDASYTFLEGKIRLDKDDLAKALVDAGLLPDYFASNRAKLSPWLTPFNMYYFYDAPFNVLRIGIEKIPEQSCNNLANRMNRRFGKEKEAELLFTCSKPTKNQSTVNFTGEFPMKDVSVPIKP